MAEEMVKEEGQEKPPVLDLLLRPELPIVQKSLPTARYKIKRLSDLVNQDVVFTLRALPYGKVQALKSSLAGDLNVHILMAGCVDPDLKAPELLKKYGGPTPAEMVKAMLLPGEIEDLSRCVEKLSGFRVATIEEIKNVSGTAATGT